MIRQTEEGDTKGGIVIPKDEFKDSCGVSKEVNGRKSRENVVHPKGGICEPCSDMQELDEIAFL